MPDLEREFGRLRAVIASRLDHADRRTSPESDTLKLHDESGQTQRASLVPTEWRTNEQSEQIRPGYEASFAARAMELHRDRRALNRLLDHDAPMRADAVSDEPFNREAIQRPDPMVTTRGDFRPALIKWITRLTVFLRRGR